MRIAAAVALWAFAGTASAEVIVAADYVSPTERYAHGVLGDKIEHAGLRVTLSSGAERTAIWSELVVRGHNAKACGSGWRRGPRSDHG